MKKRYTRLTYICVVLVAVSLCLSTVQGSAKTPKRFQSYHDIPYFAKVSEMTTQQDFMKKLHSRLNQRLLPTPKTIRFLDNDSHVTRENLEEYKKQAKKHIIHLQKKKYAHLDTNKDGEVSLREVSQPIKLNYTDAEDIYEIALETHDPDDERLNPIFEKVLAYRKNFETPAISFKLWFLDFIALDRNEDRILSSEELNTANEEAFEELTEDTIKTFESFLSFSKDSKSVSATRIGEVALIAFNTLDRNGNGSISKHERQEHYKIVVAPRKREKCLLPSLKDTIGPIYAISTEHSHALASVDFQIRYTRAFTYYTEIHIDKQSVPITLLLESNEPMVWHFTGDTQNIETAIILGPGPETLQKAYKFDHVYSGVVGLSKDRVHFGRHRCWASFMPYAKNPSPNKRAAVIQKARIDIENKFGKKPYLVEFNQNPTHIRIQSRPKINFDTKTVNSIVSRPKDYNPLFWELFTEWMPSGYKTIELDHLIAGTRATPRKVMPGWAGLAQLEHLGFIKVMDVELMPTSKRVIAILNRDLPSFFGTSINQTISLIKARKELKIPANPEETASASGFCIRSSSGEPLHGNDFVCRPKDMKYVEQLNSIDHPEIAKQQSKKEAEKTSFDAVFLSLRPFTPSMAAYKDALEIRLDIDELRCKDVYKDHFKDKCKIPDEFLESSLADYAVTSNPVSKYSLRWKKPSTLVLKPTEEGFWDPSNAIHLTVSLDDLGLPKNYMINGQRKAQTIVQPHYIEFQVSNVLIEPKDNKNKIFKLTADITSNYPLEDITGTVNYITEGSLLPDEHLEVYEDFRSAISILDPPSDDLPLIMDGLTGQVHRTFYSNKLRLPYTHLNFYNVRSAVGMNGMFSPPLWVTLPGFKEIELPDQYASIHGRANNGDAQAQYELAQLYETGDNVQKSLAKARKWYRKAASQGHLEAQVAFGQFNMDQYPYGRNYDTRPEAYYWLSLAADQDNKVAQYEIGVLYREYFNNAYGDFLLDSLEMYKKSAEQDYVPALLALAHIYEKGDGVDIDYSKSYRYYTRAAEQGSLVAKAHLAKMHYFGMSVEASTDIAYDMAKAVLLEAKRSDLEVRDVAARLVVDILLEKFQLTKENVKKIKDPFTEKVFAEFKAPFLRMWIADQLPIIRDSIVQDVQNIEGPIAKELVLRQLHETPDLLELRLVKAKLVLIDGYLSKSWNFQRGNNVYSEEIIPNVIEILDPLLNDPVLIKEVTPIIVSVHLSNNDPKSALDLLHHLMFEQYFTSKDIALGLAYYFEYVGHSNANKYYRLAESWADVYRVSFKKYGDAEKYEEYLLNEIKKYPDQAWKYEDYSRFLLQYKGDYTEALIYANKAFKLQNSAPIRRLIGSAYMVKASQLYKEAGVITQKVKDYAQLASKYAFTRGGWIFECGMYCQDVIDLNDAYYRAIKSEINNISKQQRH